MQRMELARWGPKLDTPKIKRQGKEMPKKQSAPARYQLSLNGKDEVTREMQDKGKQPHFPNTKSCFPEFCHHAALLLSDKSPKREKGRNFHI